MYEDYTIREFMDALFKGKTDVISKDNLEIIYTEYIDTAGLYDLDEFNKVGYVHFLNSRINTVKLAIELQTLFLKEFKQPYKPNFTFFRKYGYKLEWNNDELDFLEQLASIQTRELKFVSQLEVKMKELVDDRKKKSKGAKEDNAKEKRGSFIKTLNSLGKIGYKIDNYKTTVEELAYMIKEQVEQ